MARPRIPHALEMKELKYGARSDEERDRVAAALLERGRRSEAILLFEGREDHEFLVSERSWAVERGNAFHLMALQRLGVVVREEDLRICAQTAERRGRWMDARQCWLALADEEAVRRIAEHLPEGMRPLPEAEAEEA